MAPTPRIFRASLIAPVAALGLWSTFLALAYLLSGDEPPSGPLPESIVLITLPILYGALALLYSAAGLALILMKALSRVALTVTASLLPLAYGSYLIFVIYRREGASAIAFVALLFFVVWPVLATTTTLVWWRVAYGIAPNQALQRTTFGGR
jgi:hypothetical protein